jgi:hypothetical protein
MQFDPALAAQAAFRDAEAELGSEWQTVVELENIFSSNAGNVAREAYEGLLDFSRRYPEARSFQAFCIYITWQQATEETISDHFKTGMQLCEIYLASGATKNREQISELYGSFRAGLGMEEEEEIQVEFRRDTPKGGD